MSSLEWLETLGMGTDLSGVQITANSTINALGSYTNIGGVSSDVANFIVIYVTNVQQSVSYLVDIAVDEAGGSSYTNIVEEVLAVGADASGTSDGMWVCVPFPSEFASGSQFAARCRADTISATVDVHCVLYEGTTDFTVSFVESIGSDISASRGTPVDPGGVSTVKGAYSELASSLSGDVDYLVPVITPQAAQTVIISGRGVIDISTGAAASEIVKAGDIMYVETGFESRFVSLPNIDVALSSGDRIACRAQNETTTAARRTIDVVVLGFKKSTAPAGAASVLGQINMNGGFQ